MKKKIAVMMSTYNGENYIAEQINSILKQKVDADLTIYVRDDGSIDKTWEILNKIASSDSRIELFKGDNIGCVASFFNIIKKLAKSDLVYDYYSLADQDDIWEANKLQAAIDILEEKDDLTPQLYGSTSILVNEKLKPFGITQRKIKEISFFNTMIQNFTPGHSQVMNRMLLLQLLDADPSQIYVHDAYITNVAVLTGELSFDNTPHTYYRQHSANELGATNNLFNWLKSRIQRIRRGDSKKYSKQILYIYNKYKDIMTDEQRNEIDCFYRNQALIIMRIRFAFQTKLYRQNFIDNICFKLLYILGGYNICHTNNKG